ncbi:hypothetical protein D9758_012709 [Tetrapyrgos nigripes]|uniref:Gag protein n=1 Tax=Tetrapyrgos nigripes TaxID=182062 RepID=A0A8H5CVY8_9AGAR|nr:hypothetical protein D9758_012709 [Tetrapyrgos nigripes]
MTTSIPKFTGETDEKLNPVDFLRDAEVYMIGSNIPEERMGKKMHLFFKAGSRADTWYRELGEEKKAGWDNFSDEFLKEFPAPEVAKPTSSERRKELLAMRITWAELGTRDKDTQEWTHQRFAHRLLDIAKAAGIAESSSDIVSVHENLPKVLRRNVSVEAKTWQEFTTAIKNVGVQTIKDAKEDEDKLKEVEDKLRRVEEQSTRTVLIPETPSKPLARAFANAQISTPPPALPFAKKPATSRLNEAQKATLRANVDAYEQRPNTKQGENDWKNDVKQFHAKHGMKVIFNETIVIPVRTRNIQTGIRRML